MPIKDNKEFYSLTGREPESHKRIQSLTTRAYITSRPIADQIHSLFSEYHLFRKDYAKWQPTIGTEPFVGEVLGIPSMRGMMMATNGIDGFVISSSSYAFFCHFTSFVLDDETLQGEMNRCVMPFRIWQKNEEMKRIVARERVIRESSAATKPRTEKRPTIDKAALLNLFQ